MQQIHAHYAYMHILCPCVILLHLGHMLWPYHDIRENKKLQGKMLLESFLKKMPLAGLLAGLGCPAGGGVAIDSISSSKLPGLGMARGNLPEILASDELDRRDGRRLPVVDLRTLSEKLDSGLFFFKVEPN